MIDAKTLKKHNLKAVPFSCIGEGQTFNVLDDLLDDCTELIEHQRRLIGGHIAWADGFDSPIIATVDYYKAENQTVYVPVWRPC